jgi:hypothetical protein
MSATLLLFLVRVGSAALLLAFLGLIAWFLYQDLRLTRQGMAGQGRSLGALRVIANAGEGPAGNTVFELSPITTFGRNSRNTVVLDDTYVSAEHALLTWRDAQWWLEDLGSRNGTLLNDAPLAGATVVSPGDVITIGGVQMKMELAGRQAQDDTA